MFLLALVDTSGQSSCLGELFQLQELCDLLFCTCNAIFVLEHGPSPHRKTNPDIILLMVPEG